MLENFFHGLTILLLSLAPTFEGRYAYIYGVLTGLSKTQAFLWSTLGVLVLSIILPYVLGVLDNYFINVRNQFIRRMYKKIVLRTRVKSRPYIDKYGLPGLILFVAIPLPGTGVWTGSLAAYLLGIDRKKTVISLAIGGVTSLLIIVGLGVGASSVG